jgi:hypothetical protein
MEDLRCFLELAMKSLVMTKIHLAPRKAALMTTIGCLDATELSLKVDG